jgi:hypothetical protein
MRSVIGPYPPGRPTDPRTFIWSVCPGCGITIGPHIEDRDSMLHTIETSEHEKLCLPEGGTR